MGAGLLAESEYDSTNSDLWNDMIKKHWPVLFAILVVIISIILGIVASHSTDAGVAIAAGVIAWMFLFPLAGALMGGWYGWRVKTPLKWLLAPAVYLASSCI